MMVTLMITVLCTWGPKDPGKMNLTVYSLLKHLMTGPTGNSEFCFPKTLNVPRGEALNDWPQGKQ